MAWNGELLNPLMFIRDLDAPVGPPRRGRNSCRGRGRAPKRENMKRLAPASSSARVTRSQSQKAKVFELAVSNVALSESDSQEEEVGQVKRNDSPSPRLNIGDTKPTLEKRRQPDVDSNDSNCQLLADLDLSSDSSSASSSSTSSEITGPSDSEPSRSADQVEPLAGNWIGEAYFWILPSSDPSLYEDFSSLPLDEDFDKAIGLFQLVCRDYPIKCAGQLFAEKLKSFAFKQCVRLLREYYPLFERRFFKPEIDSRDLFGGIVMTLIHHWYNQKAHLLGAKLLEFMDSIHIDPLSCRPFVKIRTKRFPTKVLTGIDIALMCCEIFFVCDDFKRCVRLLLRVLSSLVPKNDEAGIDCMRPLLGSLFTKVDKRDMISPAFTLFLGVLNIQEGLHYPLNLSLFFDGVLCALVSSDDRHNESLALELFEKVNYWGYCEASGVACRGLLAVSALCNQPRSRLQKVFCMCVNKGVYPPFNLHNWTVKIYSSMTKIEMQIYIEQLLLAYAVAIRNSGSQLCDTYLTFHVEVVSSAPVRDYVHPVFNKVRLADHTLPAALHRLKSVLYYYLRVPVETVCQPCDERTFIMFSSVAKELFKKVLKCDSIERPSPEVSCIMCKYVS